MSTPKKRLPLAGSERTPITGARALGPANPSESIEVTIRLRARAPVMTASSAEAAALPANLTILSRQEFEQRHGAAPQSIARIEAFADEHGLTVEETSAARRTVVLSGTVGACSEAFGVELQDYDSPAGRYRGRTGPIYIPAELQDVIEGVFGLDNRPQAKPHFRRRRGQAVVDTPVSRQAALSRLGVAGSRFSG